MEGFILKLICIDKYFKDFCDEFNKYEDNVHSLNSGIKLNSIVKIQNKLKLQFPKRYIQFLEMCNGGELYPPSGPTIFSINNIDEYLLKLNDVYDYICTLNHKDISIENIKKLYLPFARTSYGDIICLDLSMNIKNKEDSHIINFDHETGNFYLLTTNFINWLNEVMKECFVLINYDGTDKDLSIDEIKKYI